MFQLVLKDVRLPGSARPCDVAVGDGRILKIAPNLEGEARNTIAAGGRVLIPGLIDSHIHLDKAYIADRAPNRSGTLAEAIRVTAAIKPTFTKEDIRARAERALSTMIRYGVTQIRTHAEFDPAQGLCGLETVLTLKAQYREQIDIEVVAFPQEGILKCPGTEAMMEQAMEMGADVVGAIPYNDSSATEHIDLVFELAKKYGKPLDFHQDFRDDADKLSIEYLCRKTIREGFEGRVSVGHLTALGALEPDRLAPLTALIAKAGISVMCLPATDLHLGGRNDAYNVRRTLTPVRRLRDAGVNVCLATNNIRNAFTPYGNGDLLQIALLGIPTLHLGGVDDLPSVLPMLTDNPAKALGRTDYGLMEGCRADLVLLDTKRPEDAIIDLPERLYVIKNGRIVAQNRVESVLHF